MGIDDRHYVRRDAPGGPAATGGGLRSGLVGRLGMWSVNTWIIVLCVGVFVIDNLVPLQLWKPVPVAYEIPSTVEATGGSRYVELTTPDEERSLAFERPILDAEKGEVIGGVAYRRMPPLERWLYFSTHTAVRKVEFWRFIGFQFLHANLTHLLFNMIGLFFFGPMVERYLGGKRYLAFYLLCGICGALVYLALNLGGFLVSLISGDSLTVPGLLFNSTHTPLIGASAGVFGVLMAGAFLAPRATVLLFFIIPMQLRTLAYALVALALFSVIFGGHNAGGEAGHLGALAGFYLIRHPRHLHGFFDVLGRADPTSHHYRRARQRRPDRSEIDRILEKIHARGVHSLTESEKRKLADASDRRH